MSQENVEAFRRGLDAGNRGDVEGLLEVLDPEIVWRSALHAQLEGEATDFRGHEGVREMLRDLNEGFDEIQIEISEFEDLGDRVLAIGRTHVHGGASGAHLQMPMAFVAEFKDGRATSMRAYTDPEDARRAAAG